MHSHPTLAFATLGCKTNQAETAQWAAQLADVCAVVDFDQPADVYVVNTCTVTHAAERESRQLVRRAHRTNPAARIVVSGCASQRDADAFQALPGVSWVASNLEKDAVAEAIAAWYGERSAPWRPLPPDQSGHTRAWLKISEGCNNRCSYCIVPAVRGAERSLEIPLLVERAQLLAELGYREAVLTGTNLGRYGQDQGTRLSALLRALIEQVPAIARWRLGSIEPIDFPEDLCEVLAHPRLCPQLHLCLQSGSDAVLSRMRRRYNATQYRRLVERLRRARPELALTTDVIVGFPGETEDEFRSTLELVAELGYAGVHAFPYSPRAGTPAAEYQDQLDPRTIAARMTRLGEVSARARTGWEDGFVGQSLEVLTEDARDGWRLASSPHGLRVWLEAEGTEANQIWPVVVEARRGDRLLARRSALCGEPKPRSA